MEQEARSSTWLTARLRQWREQRKSAARERRALREQRIDSERYNYRGDGAPGGPGA
jgi:hypothetical protein